MARNPLQDKLLVSQEALTPGSDVSFGFRDDLINWGRHGNDTILSFKPGTPPNNGVRQNVDILIGDLVDEILFPESFSEEELITPFFWNDKFILGDSNRPYYVDLRKINTFGLNDFAIIYDFDPSRDTIQLHGSARNYIQQKITLGTQELTAIFWQQPNQFSGRAETQFDLVALLQGNFELDLEANYFQYEGYTPPIASNPENILQLGTEGIDLALAIETDTAGNVYIAGSTDGSIGAENLGSYDVWVAKYDSEGKQIWIKQFGTPVSDLAFGISTDEESNFYLTGATKGNLGGVNQGQQDIWISKFDENGDLVWSNQFGGDNIDTSHGVDVDGDGNVYQSGIIVKDSPEEVAFPVTDDFFVTKYDENGNRQWLTEVGTEPFPGNAAFDESYDVAVGSDGSVYASGWTLSDLGGELAGLYDVWVAKFDNQGNQEWIRQFGTEAYEFAWDVELDSENNVYAAGWTLGSFEGQNSGSYDAWIAKFDAEGNQEWIQQFGSEGDDGLFLGGLAIDKNDEIFMTGFTDNDLEGTNAGSYDSWVAKFDTTGEQKWIQQFGTSSLDYSSDITSDGNGNVYVSGYTEGSLGGINAGSIDAWVTKLDAATGTIENFNPALSSSNQNTSVSSNNSEIASVFPTPKNGKFLTLEDFMSSKKIKNISLGIETRISHAIGSEIENFLASNPDQTFDLSDLGPTYDLNDIPNLLLPLTPI